MKMSVSGARRNRNKNRTISTDDVRWYRTKRAAVAAFKLDVSGSPMGGTYICEMHLSEGETRTLVSGYLRGMTLEEVIQLAAG